MDGMTWMASAMHAAQAQLDTAAHNLANVGSDGFRRVRATLALTPGGLLAGEAPTFSQGGIRETNRRFDLALLGPGEFELRGPAGSGATSERTRTRDGAFVRDRDGYLADGSGRRLWGERGPIRVSADAVIGADGTVRDGGRVVDHLALPRGTSVRSGALESSNVDAIAETLAILTAQRSFETAQKTFVAIDAARDKAVNDVGRLK
jgi:flagellar basal body rod protein FlgG